MRFGRFEDINSLVKSVPEYNLNYTEASNGNSTTQKIHKMYKTLLYILYNNNSYINPPIYSVKSVVYRLFTSILNSTVYSS